MTRTDSYRAVALQTSARKGMTHEEKMYLNALGVAAAANESSVDMRRAYIECAALDNVSLPLNDQELLVGRFDPDYTSSEERAAQIAQWDGLPGYVPANSTFHRVIDYEKLLNFGVRAVLEELENHIRLLENNVISNEQQTEYMSREDMLAFYRAGQMSLRAFCRLAKRWETRLREEATTAEPTRRRELLRMADNFVRAPYEPCEHFYEALQCMWLMQYAIKVLDDSVLTGRLDAYLYPFYEKDLNDGVITRNEAFELIEHLYYKHNELHGTWPAAVMIGGVNKDGTPVMNDLTYMCVEAIRTTKLINPSVSVCVTDETPDNFLDRCIRCIAEGYTRPAFFNDRIVQEGLRLAGVTEEDARAYVHSTCVEITPIASSHISVATPYINISRSLEYILNNGCITCRYEMLPNVFPGRGGDTEELYLSKEIPFNLSDLHTFEDFIALVRQVVSAVLESHLTADIHFQRFRDRHAASPLVSMFTNDCIARGNDCGRGGARYGFYYPCLIGFSNFIDSLAAIKKAVYEEGIVTLEELAAQCRDDFPDKRLHAYLCNIAPKFGNGDDAADVLAIDFYNFIRREFQNYRTDRGAPFFPSYFSYIYHGLMGKQTGATPDGRKAYTALSEHLGAVRGMDRNGPLGVVDSIAKLDHRVSIGGVATNFRFTEEFASSPEGSSAIREFIRFFMARDCFELQFNIVSNDDLKEAQRHPENYRTLMVRVAGYSDYFVNLDPVIQNEIIDRTEHGKIEP